MTKLSKSGEGVDGMVHSCTLSHVITQIVHWGWYSVYGHWIHIGLLYSFCHSGKLIYIKKVKLMLISHKKAKDRNKLYHAPCVPL
jgi:hypothetical protein